MQKILVRFSLAALALGLFFSSAIPAFADGTWTVISSMNDARGGYFSATLLPNGKVVVAGGQGPSGPLSSAEIYDPSSSTWTSTGSMNDVRVYFSATLLPNGKVLVAGGQGPSNGTISSAELYDPSTGTWSLTGAMSSTRYAHTATLLPNGQVLVAGGVDRSGADLPTAELYDPSTGTWTPTGSMIDGQYYHTATLLPNGAVLVVGNGAELYDPSSGSWSYTATTTNMINSGNEHTATLLPNGKVLVAGGDNAPAGAQLYDPAFNNPPVIGSIPELRIGSGGTFHFSIPATDSDLYQTLTYSATNLPSGASLDPNTGVFSWTPTVADVGTHSAITFTATDNGTPPLSSSAVANIDVANDVSWTFTSGMAHGRTDPTATLLPNDKVLVAGGYSSPTDLSSAELYDPSTGTWTSTGSIANIREQAIATLLPNGKVLVAGGVVNRGDSDSKSAELYDPATGVWTQTGSMSIDRNLGTITLLPNGKVLAAGGRGSDGISSSRLLKNPVTDSAMRI